MIFGKESNPLNLRMMNLTPAKKLYESGRICTNYMMMICQIPRMDKDQLESELGNCFGSNTKAKSCISQHRKRKRAKNKNKYSYTSYTRTNCEFSRSKKHFAKLIASFTKKENSLEILKKAFSTNGLIAYKIETLVKELEELTNRYLGELSDGRFTLSFIVTNDKLNVRITDNGNIVDILALSSGELARVNTATLLAIRKLMSSISKSKINILFLDEVINVLDDIGREKIVEVLLQEKDLNTYIVSHGWTHPLLEKIEVVKKGNVSRLEW